MILYEKKFLHSKTLPLELQGFNIVADYLKIVIYLFIYLFI